MSNDPIDQRWRGVLGAFFVLAYCLTWGFAWMATTQTLALPAGMVNLGKVLLHHGPALAALLVVSAAWGKAGLGWLLKPLLKWRVGAQWYLFVLLFPLAVRLLAVGIDYLLGGRAPSFFTTGTASGVPEGIHPLVLLAPVFLGVLVQAGLAEEIGWRGLALPWLQARFSALPASLILGILWTLWHYDPQRIDFLLDKGALYPLSVLAFTLLLTWVYNSTGGSLLLMVLFHTASNTADWIVPTTDIGGVGIVASERPFMIQLALMWASALLVWWVFKGRDLAHQARVQAKAPQTAAKRSATRAVEPL